MNQRFASAAVLVVAMSTAAQAEIFRCTAPGGAVTYQEVPCPPSAQVRAMDIPAAFPEVNRAERDRLLQREAALDARLLKRAEIDAAERIARDERAARERERDREREREAAVAATPPILLIQPFPIPRLQLHRRPPLQRGA